MINEIGDLLYIESLCAENKNAEKLIAILNTMHDKKDYIDLINAILEHEVWRHKNIHNAYSDANISEVIESNDGTFLAHSIELEKYSDNNTKGSYETHAMIVNLKDKTFELSPWETYNFNHEWRSAGLHHPNNPKKITNFSLKDDILTYETAGQKKSIWTKMSNLSKLVLLNKPTWTELELAERYSSVI